jgi:hypothetical protein
MSSVYDGMGNCLLDTPRHLLDEYNSDFYKDPDMICYNNCEIKKCLNYSFCNQIGPELYLLKTGMCYECDETFETYICSREKQDRCDITECPICLETKLCMTQPKCNHYTCIDCIKRCYYTDHNLDIEHEPEFPYDDNIKKEFHTDIYNGIENPKWTEDPLIESYEEAWANWDGNRQTTHEREIQYLRKCPLCRK